MTRNSFWKRRRFRSETRPLESFAGPLLPVLVIVLTFPIGCGSAPDEPARRLTVHSIQSLSCRDCDGIALGDINNNGRTDILASNGTHGSTFWFEQGENPEQWTRHPIFTIPGPTKEIEGNDLGDLTGDGRLEAISLDQPNGVIYLHRHRGDPSGEWDTVALMGNRPFLQASLVTDVDGDGVDDLVYSWEGDSPGTGGIHWIRFTGTNPLDPEQWQDHVMVQHESAWWIASRRVDLNGDGRATDLVFTARNLPNRNPGARPGVYWLEEPADVFSTWPLHEVDRELNHPLHIDLGDLSGDGHGKDLVVGGFDTRKLYWYRFSDGWDRNEVHLPETLNGDSPDRIWNVKTLRSSGNRDGILAPVTGSRQGGLLHFRWYESGFVSDCLLNLDYFHPMEDRILLHHLYGEGFPTLFVPDSGSGSDRLFLIRLQTVAATEKGEGECDFRNPR